MHREVIIGRLLNEELQDLGSVSKLKTANCLLYTDYIGSYSLKNKSGISTILASVVP